ncbi:MAG TPA: glutamine amidotransferase [Verrucomicrobiae bacterium]|nr:glutamine amidotransferase [Verrucomicrobiae bacterium]
MFELLFKYPASLFHKGHFVLLTPWPVWLLAVAILAAAGLLFWHVRRNHGMLGGVRPIAIWLLESAMVAVILFLLWHPALSVATLRPQQNVVAVLVDDSRSMSINDSSGTRETAAKKVLQDGLLKSLSDKFQVRLYKFGAEADRIQKDDQLAGTQPATRLGDTLEQVMAESSSMPLGAVVVLSDGADNSGGISLDTVAAIRRERIPVHTIGFGREQPDKDVEVEDVVLPARALPQSKLSAVVTLQSYGVKGQKAHLTVKDGGKLLASREIVMRGDGDLQTETLVFNCGDAGPKSFEIGVDPVGGEQNTVNNRVTRLVDVEKRVPRILYVEGEPRWQFKFIRRALDDYKQIELVTMLRTTQNKLYRQGTPDPPEAHELEDGFPSKPEELFRYQALIFGSVEASYFTPTQQQLIHDFVDRRGGGVLFSGGRAALSDGGYQNSPLADLLPVQLLPTTGTFHRDFTPVELTGEGADSVICRLDDDPARNRARWANMPMTADWQEVGERKPGAVVLLESAPKGRRKNPLLVTENYGRGRTMLLSTGGAWRWRMWLMHDDNTSAMFWQQVFRYLVTDTPGQVSTTTPKQMLSDTSRVPIRVDVRDKEFKPVANAKVQARFTNPDGSTATLELTPKPLEEGVYVGEYDAEKPGTYVADVLAGRDQEEIGHDMLTFRREDGVAESFHTSQNRDLLEKLSDQTGGRYYKPDQASKLAEDITYSEAGITARETRDLWDMPALFLLVLAIRAAEWLLRRKWGVV